MTEQYCLESSSTSLRERAAKRANEVRRHIGLLAIGVAAQKAGIDQVTLQTAASVWAGTMTPIQDAASRAQTTEIATSTQPEVSTLEPTPGPGASRIKSAAIAATLLPYSMYYFGEDGMAIAANEAFSARSSNTTAAIFTGLAVTGWNWGALHYNEFLLRSITKGKKQPSRLVESERPLVQQGGLIISNIKEVFDIDPDEAHVDEEMQKSGLSEKMKAIKGVGTIVNTIVAGAPVGFNDELIRTKQSIARMSRAKIEALMLKHSAIFGSTWGLLAATRGHDTLDKYADLLLRPENLALGLTYYFGTKVTNQIFAKREETSESEVSTSPLNGPVSFTEEEREMASGTIAAIVFDNTPNALKYQ